MPAKKSAAKPRSMSEAHKAALAEGRELGRVVRQYLEALETSKPKRGRKRTPESIQKRLDKIQQLVPTADPTKRLSLIQERIDLEGELASMTESVDLSALEKAFVEVAKRYSETKGVSYAAWREVGVPAAVLKEAGLSRAAA